MKRAMMSAAAVAVLLASVPLAAQPYNSGYNRGWNSNDFWRGAPSGIWERIDFLQRRIDRGERDGSLNRYEARRAQRELRRIRQDASYMRRGGFNGRETSQLQARLDNLSRNLRWMRHNDDYGGYRGDDYYARYRTDYDATRYYRDGPQYRERRLTAEDEVYRGSDGRYYCKRSDGTTGLIVGAAAGGLLGNVVDGGHDRLAGTLIGGALGALAGKAIDQNSDVRCR
ncbi:MAG TPA: glycine zipper 2TM domain-containing protein [Allosphingosinicella sp.]|nr:glycine zipper 2TM domain-containing protein [Allosphingosinicella sp.]